MRWCPMCRSLSSSWEHYFSEASIYYAEHGDLNVPKLYTTPGGLSLGVWLITQRRVREGQIQGNLTEQQIARLDSIGMVWGNRKEIAWQHGFEVAKKYHDTYGNLMVAGKYVAPDGYPLGQWIIKTRQQKLNGRLKEERIAQLDEIGMVWSVFDAKWEKAYALAAAYYEENGNLNIPRSYVTASGERLGLWLASQQWSYPKGKLSDEQVERLNRIGMYWGNRNDRQWNEGYQEAKRYFEAYNSSLAFMHELSQRSYPSDGILSVYDLILIPKWVMEEIEDSTYRSTYVEQLQAKGYPIRWIDETKYGTFVNFEDVNLYYIVEAAVSRVSELMRFLRRKVKTEDLIDLPSAEEWMNRLYDEWPIHGRTLSTGRTLKKNAGEISLTILAEIFAWYHDGVDSLTIYTQDTDAHKFQTNAERILTENSEFTPALDSPISVAFKSNDFILCQMYREGALTLDAVRQLRRDDRKLTYTRQQADKSIICRKEVITKEQFIDLIQDATVQILF